MRIVLILMFITVGIFSTGCVNNTKLQFVNEASYFIINDGLMLVQYLLKDDSKILRLKQPVRSRLNSLIRLINKLKESK